MIKYFHFNKSSILFSLYITLFGFTDSYFNLQKFLKRSSIGTDSLLEYVQSAHISFFVSSDNELYQYLSPISWNTIKDILLSNDFLSLCFSLRTALSDRSPFSLIYFVYFSLKK